MRKLNEYQTICIDDGFLTKADIRNLYRLQNQLLEEENIVATLEECINIWQRYSYDLRASWLFFPENDKDILRYISSSDFFTSYEDFSN